MSRVSKRRCLCPRCHKFSFLSRRWVESIYFPKYWSVAVISLEESCKALRENQHDEGNRSRFKRWKSVVKGNVYRDTSEGHLMTSFSEDERHIPDRESWYRVTYGRYWQYYVAHYDPNKYKKQMIDYKDGRRRSRPNGRRECKIRNCDWRRLGLYNQHAHHHPLLHC
jgi:hypothetical protein